ncbi:MAG: GTPase ObgE [Spirochaetales bacterium]|nr:GTPase ObgE [Spirochaetales bacterium]MCF7937989.1 GTPase ObgE [Spirochaetales bacterium]
MEEFVDEAVIEVSSGKGGDGSVSFRREKYVPKGGPDGGDGGNGGNVLFQVDSSIKTLYQLRTNPHIKAKNGLPGMGKRRHGKQGDHAVVRVPPGTVVRDEETGMFLRDLVKEGETWQVLKGGRGGWGNWHFRSSTRQTPRFAKPGLPGDTLRLRVELRIIADVGLVGFPNAGKSTLLSVVTGAHPKIAGYPFTTKVPNLGILYTGGRELILADIPGIIEGAAEGAGLGLQFLRHITRTRVLVFLIDLSEDNFIDHFPVLLQEMEAFSADLLEKPRLVAASKLDLAESGERMDELKQSLPSERVLGISSAARIGFSEFERALTELIKEAGTGEQEK